MIQYILEGIAFQLLFLIIYDLFLKKETFFQWNRVYLIGTYVLSMVLPWVKIEALKTKVSNESIFYPEFLWNLNDAELVVNASQQTEVSWVLIFFLSGIAIATLLFVYKLIQIFSLKKKGDVHYFNDYTRVVIKNSEIAFSYFKSIFLGDKVVLKEHNSVIAHELVHIQQGHSYDLIFFEILRILNWFNPLVYVYQSRISEVHEFIADSIVVKTNKKEHYQLLLSQVFQTQHISFINPFFKSSLIKKRIVMLQKSKSKKVFQLKYLVLIPLISGMLVYTSCEGESKIEAETEITETSLIVASSKTIEVNDLENQSEEEKKEMNALVEKAKNAKETAIYTINDKNGKYIEIKTDETGIVSVDVHTSETDYDNELSVPFGVVEEVPVFPGCEDAEDKRACFQKAMYKHISKNFKYPEEAQEQGIQGKVNLLFIIQEDGSIGGLKMRGPSPLLEDEASRIISKLPIMTPGKQKGKIVKVPFSIPITFKLK
ncbi:TonB family protein [Cellulophaga baltica]|uniref:TonB family protein n=1 Tax=Cellulophaga TaxID=104264 RepID=UPI001C078625|nr:MULTISPECIES: TonB family protein [Cellulophaga]MBU2995243.1 TonB family protein [Cellulophaga baltica]MDO6766638.1 TonB family protein [Cellulophaga sp. 1_MG-2023]